MRLISQLRDQGEKHKLELKKRLVTAEIERKTVSSPLRAKFEPFSSWMRKALRNRAAEDLSGKMKEVEYVET